MVGERSTTQMENTKVQETLFLHQRKREFKSITVKKNKQRHYIMIKDSIQEEK